MKWVSVKERLPKDNDMIVYCNKTNTISQTGRYSGVDDPMPSAPYWLPWSEVTHWMPLPEVPDEVD